MYVGELTASRRAPQKTTEPNHHTPFFAGMCKEQLIYLSPPSLIPRLHWHRKAAQHGTTRRR